MSKETKLYYLSEALQNAIDGGYTINEETGEILWSPDDLDALEIAVQEKAEACVAVVKNQRAMAKALREEAKVFNERASVLERSAKSIEEYIASCTMKLGGVIETIKCKLSFRKSTKVQVNNIDIVPEEFLRVKVEVDKVAVAKAIKAGTYVPGCALVEEQNLQIK